MGILGSFTQGIEKANDLLALWRAQRAYKVGKVLSYTGVALALIVLFTDIFWSPWPVIAVDVLLLVGSFLSLVWTRNSTAQPYFCWWPLYFTFWIKMWPSVLYTGGVASPFVGIYLSLLYIAGVVIQNRFRPVQVAVFAFLNIPALYVSNLVYPIEVIAPYPDIFITIMHLIGYAALVVCGSALLKTEMDLSSEFSNRYLELTEAKAELKKEEASNFAKTTFMANVSHELRTPLGAIVGYSEMLRDPSHSAAEKEKFAETISRNGHQLARLVDDLLDLSKVEAGTVEIDRAQFKINDLLNDVLDLSSLKAEQKNIPIHLHYLNEVPELLYSDFTRLRQILLNLVNNAIKFTDDGEILITVEHLAGADGGQLEIEVADTGRGILEDEKKRLFKPFSQGDPTLARRYGGTGLGLNLSRKLAELLGGTLDLASTEAGGGSTFSIRIPIGIEAQQDSSTEFKRGQPQMGSFSPVNSSKLTGRSILVVDDTIDNQQLIKTFLSSTGAIVDLASDGFRGIQMALQNKYDVILMDIQMPQMDGYQAIGQLREKNYSRPVLALTAHAMREDIDRSLAAGFDGHLTKPISKTDLIKAIEHAVEI